MLITHCAEATEPNHTKHREYVSCYQTKHAFYDLAAWLHNILNDKSVACQSRKRPYQEKARKKMKMELYNTIRARFVK